MDYSLVAFSSPRRYLAGFDPLLGRCMLPTSTLGLSWHVSWEPLPAWLATDRKNLKKTQHMWIHHDSSWFIISLFLFNMTKSCLPEFLPIVVHPPRGKNLWVLGTLQRPGCFPGDPHYSFFSGLNCCEGRINSCEFVFGSPRSLNLKQDQNKHRHWLGKDFKRGLRCFLTTIFDHNFLRGLFHSL